VQPVTVRSFVPQRPGGGGKSARCSQGGHRKKKSWQEGAAGKGAPGKRAGKKLGLGRNSVQEKPGWNLVNSS